MLWGVFNAACILTASGVPDVPVVFVDVADHAIADIPAMLASLLLLALCAVAPGVWLLTSMLLLASLLLPDILLLQAILLFLEFLLLQAFVYCC